MPKLKDILNLAIERRNKEVAAKRKDKERNMDVHALLKASLTPRMTSGQNDMMHEQTAKLQKLMESNNASLDSLKIKIDTVLRPVSARF